MISLKQLNYALAVEKTLHFRRAAEHCSVSQSALSTAIIELERQLGVQLFERTRKQILITPVGRRILAKTRDIKARVEELSQLAQTQQYPLSHALTLGVIPTIGPYLLPKVLPKVRERYPDFELRIVEEPSQTLVEMVQEGDIDAAILALPYDTRGLHLFEFWRENFFLVTHRTSPFAARDSISSADLRQTQLMLLKNGHCLRDHALAVSRVGPDEINRTFAASSLHTLIQMVAGRIGATLVPAMALEQLMSGCPELKAVRLDEPGPHRQIAFATRLNYAGVDSVNRLRALFHEHLMGGEPQAVAALPRYITGHSLQS